MRSFEKDMRAALATLEYASIPEDMGESLIAYVTTHRETGSCLQALLANDLFDFVGRADPDTLGATVALVKLVYNHMPAACNGSRAKVEAWIERGG